MLSVVLITVLSAGAAGFVIKWLLDQNTEPGAPKITWREFKIVMACTPVLAMLTAWAGWAMARSSNMTFYEYHNGWEVSAIKSQITCSRDGPCRWEYDCDPYIVMVSYDCNCTTDDKGHTSCSTCWRPETRYHDCPYVNREYNYSIKTTLGEYDVVSYVFPDNPQANRWRVSESIPQSVINSAGVGDPPFWTEVRKRCEANAPGPVSKRSSYNNYILASERTLMKQYSSDIEDYKKKGLLPDLPKSIEYLYGTNKVRFIGSKPWNYRAWERGVEYLNGALGTQLRGDLMLVIVNNPSVSSNPERYTLALKAHWQDKTAYGADALPKNAMVVVLGTDDGNIISWSRAFTAMPLGNEKMTTVLRDGLKGLPMVPEKIIGPIQSRRDQKGVWYPPDSNGIMLPRILWGIDDPSTKFIRVSMSGDDGKGGFLYLKGEIQPTTGQAWAIGIVSFILCIGIWLWAANHRDTSEGPTRFGGYHRR
ncbi:MAG: hypothetical protein A3B99_00970 [Candidatus Yanofskybacteria bacterium RIFCSPHIGHO2_02_FULL_44_12b]|uniref:Uncharacterized protein n=2 Tax=Candidatus Yanofskyibacteriota TaxID=1752733 RepID=A0A1F8GL39_9BACT|nr:MAG: hypothetical protein UW79_C0015G0007 [Candidatus Yanofskybacteria bacterium GW2011_GWA2_44_9]OGN04507.1 MAG: hypothetical protein A2659_02075 [Candidatus Yanofskybacteria bacterium RIFCSPHIGHO2_01_FULL_44_24]OGN15801.1 MAG: hypothetical protein A3B99_00970 [Candidatus Yanofskybacteria bacterium RIFCSPHIGHO2_02_FULL_44_12b]OGN26127.1 MAG: hypothetical protein A2925_04990 [Candidatus Yanofskybacteria bacterium RIFCSPLOWO2_01_FULL_44_22]